MARKRKTSLQAEYDRTRKTLEKRISNMQRKGYIFDEKSMRKALPAKPQNVTRGTINTLKKRTEKYIAEKSGVQYWDPVAGKVTSGVRGRELEYRQRQKPDYIDDVEALIEGMRREINNYKTVEAARENALMVEYELDSAISKNKRSLYKRLKDVNDTEWLHNTVFVIMYYDEESQRAMEARARDIWQNSMVPVLRGEALALGESYRDEDGDMRYIVR